MIEDREVEGSIPSGGARDPGAHGVPPCHPFGGVLIVVAQSAERPPVKRLVPGSNPGDGAGGVLIPWDWSAPLRLGCAA